MRVEYVVISIVLFVVVLLVILGFAQDIVPNFSEGIDSILGMLE